MIAMDRTDGVARRPYPRLALRGVSAFFYGVHGVPYRWLVRARSLIPISSGLRLRQILFGISQMPQILGFGRLRKPTEGVGEGAKCGIRIADC